MKAFLSHTGANKVLVRLVHERLTRENAWFDVVDIENGDSIPEKISEGLRVQHIFQLYNSIFKRMIVLVFFQSFIRTNNLSLSNFCVINCFC